VPAQAYVVCVNMQGSARASSTPERSVMQCRHVCVHVCTYVGPRRTSALVATCAGPCTAGCAWPRPSVQVWAAGPVSSGWAASVRQVQPGHLLDLACWAVLLDCTCCTWPAGLYCWTVPAALDLQLGCTCWTWPAGLYLLGCACCT